VTLTKTFTVDEVPTNASGAVVVTVTRWDGTVLDTGNATAVGPPGVYSWTLDGGLTAPASVTWQLDHLTVSWSATVGGSAVRLAQAVEVVGGFYFDVPRFRNEFKDYASAARYPAATLAEKRSTVEREIERVTWRAFVPRFAVDHTYGSGTRYLGLLECEPRLLRTVTVGGTPWTVDQITTVGLMGDGMLVLPEGGVWPKSVPITIEYEYGVDFVPEPVEEAAMYRMRSRLARPGTSVPDNAQSYTTTEGAIYRLGQGGRDKTGIPHVDSDLIKFGRKRRAVIA
jgi:hypothetical protein